MVRYSSRPLFYPQGDSSYLSVTDSESQSTWHILEYTQLLKLQIDCGSTCEKHNLHVGPGVVVQTQGGTTTTCHSVVVGLGASSLIEGRTAAASLLLDEQRCVVYPLVWRYFLVRSLKVTSVLGYFDINELELWLKSKDADITDYKLVVKVSPLSI